jgi:hypothetical protein
MARDAGSIKKMVRIVWIDSTSHEGWRSYSDADKAVAEGPSEIETIGYLYKDSGDNIAVVQSYCDHSIDGLFIIPRACVKSMETLADREPSDLSDTRKKSSCSCHNWLEWSHFRDCPLDNKQEADCTCHAPY